jgi:Flp pilus assembly protein TadD
VAFTAERAPQPAPVDTAAARERRELARRALERGDARRAAVLGIESVELDPTDAEAWLVLGAAEMASGEHGQARSTFTACTKVATRGPRHECAQMLQ